MQQINNIDLSTDRTIWSSIYKKKQIAYIVENGKLFLVIDDYYYSQQRLDEEHYAIQLNGSLTMNTINKMILNKIIEHVQFFKDPTKYIYHRRCIGKEGIMFIDSIVPYHYFDHPLKSYY